MTIDWRDRIATLGAVIVSILVVLGFGAVCIALFFLSIPQEMKELAMLLLGILGAGFTTVVQYWMGSSSSNQKKDLSSPKPPARHRPPSSIPQRPQQQRCRDMQTSEQGRKLILDREGCRLSAYLDSVGVPTIGCGHTKGVVMGMTITEEEAMDLLAEDLKWSEAAVNEGVTVPLEQNQFDALVSFVFNVGQGAFASSTMRRLLNEGRYTEIAPQFDRWHIPPEITSRRNGERDQFRGTQFVARD